MYGIDPSLMLHAVELAKRGSGWVNPNPLVGAVVVKDDRIIGEGWHTAYGKPHAEREALANCTEDPAGATIYVTLEPCCHTGKQPPCTQALIDAGIARVVMGAPDPNPLVAGKGIQQLRDAGIEVIEGIHVEECQAINKPFFYHIQTGRPYVFLKYAMTLDGKIATYSGQSQWITSEMARKRVHEDRHRYMAIMVGVNTVIADNPQLTCRLEGENVKQPVRIVADTHLRTPLDAQLVTTAHEVPTILATTNTDSEAQKPYRDAGCQIIEVPEQDGHVDLAALMDSLGAQGIDSLIIEGGSELNWSALQAGIVNEVQAYVAPKIFGGKTAPGPVGGHGVPTPDEAFQFGAPTITTLGPDVLLECEVI